MRCIHCKKELDLPHAILRSFHVVNTRESLTSGGMNKETAELAVDQIIRPHLQSMRLSLSAFLTAWYRGEMNIISNHKERQALRVKHGK